MAEEENALQRRNAETSLVLLALRVLRGELTEDQAIQIVRTAQAKAADK